MSQAGFEAARNLILAEYFSRVHPIYLGYLKAGEGGILKDYVAFCEEIHPHMSWAINQVAQARARLGETEKGEA